MHCRAQWGFLTRDAVKVPVFKALFDGNALGDRL